MNPPQVYMCSPSWTLLPPPSPYHPSGSSQCTSPKHPVSCIEPGLFLKNQRIWKSLSPIQICDPINYTVHGILQARILRWVAFLFPGDLPNGDGTQVYILLLIPFSKEPLDKGERGEWKSWLKTQYSKNWDHGIRSDGFMANRWGKVETVTDFIFLASKITSDSDWSHEIKGCLLLGRKAMTNLDRILKNRDITLSTKFHVVKAMLFPVVMLWMWELDHK